MAGREPGPEELSAAEIVVGVLGGSYVSRDGVGAPDGMHEFDVRLPDARVLALEVTTALDGDAVKLSIAAFGKDGAPRRWPAPGLANDWILTIEQRPLPVAKVMGAMPRILEVFERHGRDDVDPAREYGSYMSPHSTLPPELVEAAREMVKLGVNWARIFGARVGPEALMFITISGGFWGDPDAINRVLAERAEPKRKKLARAKADGADECHLWMWLDGTQSQAELAMVAEPPPGPPTIPEEIDVVWVATMPLGKPQKLWRARRSAPWEILW